MDTIYLLKCLTQAFDKSNFTIHSKCITEMHDLVLHSGYERKFLSLLETRLKTLQAFGHKTHMHVKEFESLKGEPNMYSMHIAMPNCNMRVLYSYGGGGEIFLLAFHEEEDKKITEYSSHIKPARIRFAELLEE